MNFVTEVVVPALGLTALVLVAATLAVPRRTRSQSRLAAGILMAVLTGLAAGSALFYWLYGGRLPASGAAGFLLRLSGLAALLWGPVLALWWFVAAQGVERRRGEDLRRSGQKNE